MMPIDIAGSETPFNMAMLFYIRLNKFLEIKDIKLLENDLYTGYKALAIIYDNIYFKIDKSDRIKVEDMFKDVENLLSNPIDSMQIRNINGQKIWTKLREIHRELFVLMDKKNMIFPNFDARTGVEKLRGRYHLDGQTNNNA